MKQYVQVDIPRFKAYCQAFGGQKKMSVWSGVSPEYIATRLNKFGGLIRKDVFDRACELHSFPKKLLIGRGTDEEFARRLAHYRVAVEELAKSKDKHKKCDSYCAGCTYACWAAATPLLPPERYCDYYYQTKEVRGCPAGQGCTKRKPKGANRAKVNILLRGSHIQIRRPEAAECH